MLGDINLKFVKCVVKHFNSSELYQNSKFWFEIDSSPPLCDSIIYLASPVCEIVLFWCWLPCELAVPVLVLPKPSYPVLPLDNFMSICECFGQFRGSFAAILESRTSRPIIAA